MLTGPTYSIGRDPHSSIVLSANRISRHHAILMRVPQSDHHSTYRLMDGNLVGEPSLNGIEVNGIRCYSHDLQDGDEVVFGGCVKAYYYWREVEAKATIPAATLRSIRLEPVSTCPTVIMQAS